MTLSLLYKYPNESRPELFVQDYTSNFFPLKDLTTAEWVERILDFFPHWMNTESGGNFERLVYALVDHELTRLGGNVSGYTGLRYLYEQVRWFMKSCFLSTAESNDLYKLGYDLAKIYPRQGEHDWYYRYRVIEKIYEMKPNRSNLERLILKWLGTYSQTILGSMAIEQDTYYRYRLSDTYEYRVSGEFYNNIRLYKNNIIQIKNHNYREVGHIGEISRYIDFFEQPAVDDIITYEIIDNTPKTLNILGSEFEPVTYHQVGLSRHYAIGDQNNYNLLVYKNGNMLRPYEDYSEKGEENGTSRHVYFWTEPEDTDELKFDILGHSSTQGYHMVNTKHHILEQNNYGFYGDGSLLCYSDDDLKIGDLVNYDPIENTCEYANATTLEANGIVCGITVNGTRGHRYIVQTYGQLENRNRNSDRTFEWNFTPSATLYLDTVNGGITEIAPVGPNIVQEIGVAITPNKIQLTTFSLERTAKNFYNSPTGKFNVPATVYIVITNAINIGANFYNYKPKTLYFDAHDFYDAHSFYGIGHEILYDGVEKDSLLYNLMNEVKYSKPAGIHVIYELHPLDFNYNGRDINNN